METKRLGAIETRFAELIWANAPLSSPELVRLCAEALGWKKSTTYTMLKKLVDKGYVKNENATVAALVSRETARAEESRYVVATSFAGSLPSFLVSFLGGKTISDEEAEKLKQLIDAHREGE